MSTIIEEQLLLLPQSNAKVEAIGIGKRYLAIKLNSGRCAVSYRPQEEAPFPPLDTVIGKPAIEIAKMAMSEKISEKAIGIAAINALIEHPPYIRYGDPLDAIDWKGKVVGMIGYFHPVVKKFGHMAKEIRVVERNHKIEGVQLFEPKEALDGAQIVIITGSAILYGGMEEYLQLSQNAEEVLVLGPTSSMHPEPFFRRGATVVGGVEVLDDKVLFSSEKGCEDVFFASRKIYFHVSDFKEKIKGKIWASYDFCWKKG
ncbi:MAG: DUF364 domain-containing protein [Desulfobacterota bacterium]|nr:DUF364 domain-containing protein [Thermodesulfobacteriota bacterium]